MAALSTYTVRTGLPDTIRGRPRLLLVIIIKTTWFALDIVNNTHLKYFVAVNNSFCSRETIKRCEPHF